MRAFFFFTAAFLFFMGCADRHHVQVSGEAVHLYLEKTGARTVYFASSLDGYALHQARRIDPNRWEVDVSADTEFSYFYVIDGTVYVPPCRFKERDDFGSENCLFLPGL